MRCIYSAFELKLCDGTIHILQVGIKVNVFSNVVKSTPRLRTKSYFVVSYTSNLLGTPHQSLCFGTSHCAFILTSKLRFFLKSPTFVEIKLMLQPMQKLGLDSRQKSRSHSLKDSTFQHRQHDINMLLLLVVSCYTHT